MASLSNSLIQKTAPFFLNPLFRTMASLSNPLCQKIASFTESLLSKNVNFIGFNLSKRWPHFRIHSFKKMAFNRIHFFRWWLKMLFSICWFSNITERRISKMIYFDNISEENKIYFFLVNLNVIVLQKTRKRIITKLQYPLESSFIL